ncbi:fascin domain-containing protein [Pseudomonas sp. NPDC089530]|uniref:fascin domain-containing protein n=1 Tax=Pseudomonas sp. NPDC089530 TaxID=3390651 RepID=UPI003D02711C
MSEKIMVLKADNNKYLSRISRVGAERIEASKAEADVYCRFVMHDLKGSRITLKADNNKYLAVVKGPVSYIEPIKLVPDADCEFVLERVSEYRVLLKAANGKYLSRNGSYNAIEANKVVPDASCQFIDTILVSALEAAE